MRSLESLGLKPDNNPSLSMVLLPIFDTKLPRELKEKWEFELTKYDDDEDDKEINIKKFFRFLEGHVLSKEAHDDMKSSSPKPRKRFGRETGSRIPDNEEYTSAQALVGSSDFKKVKCGFCGKNHETIKCPSALNKPPDERWQMLMKRKGAPTCFNCLQPGSISHNSRTCKAPRCPVDECGRKHHQLLHTSDKPIENEGDIQVVSGFVCTNKQTLLPTASAKLMHEDKECQIRILLDSGSQETFLKKSIADDLNMKSQGSPATMNIKVLGGQEQRKRMDRVRFMLTPLHSGVDQAVSIDAWKISSVCAPLTAVDVDVKKCAHLRNLKLADTFPRKAAPVDLLDRRGYNSHVDSDKNRRPKRSTETFWELDAIGVVDQQNNVRYVEEEDALNQFNSSCNFNGDRYEVGLPWKKDHPPLVDNYQQAYQRLISIERNLIKHVEKKRMYCDAVNQYIDDGHARAIVKEDSKADKIRYLPHHAVFREDRTTTKCRVVFDSSAKTADGVSLNSCLLKGPKLQPDLGHVMIRFRCHRIGLMADIKKMFLQIKLKREDQNSHRFLWRDFRADKTPDVYCMTRITFGDTPSPFLSIATVQKHVREHEEDYPVAAKEVKENMYVDDILTGAPDDDCAVQLKDDLCNLLSKGGFPLTKWASNSQKVMEVTPLRERAPTLMSTADPEKMCDSLKALGTSWNTQDDLLTFTNISSILTEADPRTKRSLISLYSRIFDPMGLLTPFLMVPKLLFQELWARGLDWDQSLDSDIAEAWETWKQELADVSHIEVHRCLLHGLASVDKVELHGFGDASQRAYGSAVYLCAEDREGNRVSNLVMAKSRVAPAKQVTLPRLELLAAFITAKLINYVMEALQIMTDAVYAWSDSQIALAWIKGPSSRWKVFVANRVQDIQQRVAPSQWRFCPGNQNPADFLTRGISASQLKENELWWNGPQWLKQSCRHWPVRETLEREDPKCLVEARKETQEIPHASCFVYLPPVDESTALATRYETWQRLIRITAWILKWLRLHGQPKEGKLSAQEIKESEFVWLRNRQRIAFLPEIEELCNKKQVSERSCIVKLDPQFDETKRLLVVGGRLQFAQIPEEEKHQIIIPHNDPVIEKLIMHVHVKASHAGPETTLAVLRQRFWLTQGRREVKRVLRKCLTCKHWRTQPVQQKMAPLPAERVQIAPPFTNIGLDFTGPLYLKVKEGSKTSTSKAYVCIFICEDSRAVHLELLNSMTTEDFLQAFRRMANRRGLTEVIHSDNQTTFHKAAKVFKASTQRMKLAKIDPSVVENKLADQGVKWKFITERASHRGGCRDAIGIISFGKESDYRRQAALGNYANLFTELQLGACEFYFCLPLVPYFLVENEIFALKPWLLRPYPGKNIKEDQSIFNYRLSRARRVIENCFGILVARWRIFCGAIQAKVETVQKIVQATVALHNYLRQTLLLTAQLALWTALTAQEIFYQGSGAFCSLPPTRGSRYRNYAMG
ncbi:PREDICTED: uncharacterized protein LOC107350789 [Acropora digitifera]|uniref:uncharacterized protein LOC107350789 n=1 Tax=Acropora digitifera TaxID=70779 RepID=UPI00077ACBC1|nr:PREDICTED: uncharacterized protein LOC107350789 [Acropora digitifera]